MLIAENGNRILDLELIFKHNKARLKLERLKPITTKEEMLRVLKERRRSVAFVNFSGKEKNINRTAFFVDLSVLEGDIDSRWGIGFHIFVNWQTDQEFLSKIGNFSLAKNGKITLDGKANIDCLDSAFMVNKLPLIFTYYLEGFVDRSTEYEAEVIRREQNKPKIILDTDDDKEYLENTIF